MLDLNKTERYEVAGTKENAVYQLVDRFHEYDVAFRTEEAYGISCFGEGSAENLYKEFKGAMRGIIYSGIRVCEFDQLLRGAVVYYNKNALCPSDIKVDEQLIKKEVSTIRDSILESEAPSVVEDAEAVE